MSELNLTNKATAWYRRFGGVGLTGLSGGFTLLVLLPLGWVMLDVFMTGLKQLKFPDTFTQLPPAPGLSGGGLGNAIVGTILTLGLGAIIAVPFGILAAVWLSEYGRGSKLAYWVRFSANVLTGVPAILCGLFAYSIVVVPMGNFSGLSAGVALAVLMLPIVTRSVEEALTLVPIETRYGALGVGSTYTQMILFVVLPAAAPGIVTGVVIALARTASEAAPLLFTALNNNFWSWDITGPLATLPVVIYFFAIIPYKAQQEMAWAAAVVLLVMVLIFSIIARLLSMRSGNMSQQ